MVRVVALLLAVIGGWLGLLDPASTTVSAAGSTVVTYTYDYLPHAAVPANDLTQRGPPAEVYIDTVYNADDRWSNGPVTRLEGPTAPSTTYADPGTLAQGARAWELDPVRLPPKSGPPRV